MCDKFWIKTPYWFLRYLWRKIVIIRSISEVRREFAGKSPKILRVGSMGVYGMDASALSSYFVFKNDADLKEAEEKGYTKRIQDALLESLMENGYPIKMLTDKFVSSVSQEDINKKAGGLDFYYFH